MSSKRNQTLCTWLNLQRNFMVFYFVFVIEYVSRSFYNCSKISKSTLG